MLQERRATPRIRAYRPIRIHQSGSFRVVETLTKDLSGGGLCCLSPVALPVSSNITVELILSTGQEPLTIQAKTAWFRAIPESEQFDLGISFAEIPQAQQRHLSAYLDHLSKKLAVSVTS